MSGRCGPCQRCAGHLHLSPHASIDDDSSSAGMTVALKDVELLSNQLSDLVLTSEQAAATSESSVSSEAELEAAIQTFYARRHLHASTINILANALYRVFSRLVPDCAGCRVPLPVARARWGHVVMRHTNCIHSVTRCSARLPAGQTTTPTAPVAGCGLRALST